MLTTGMFPTKISIVYSRNSVHLAFSIIAIFQTVTSTTFGALGVDYATALYSTSLATTVYCTAVIVYRVMSVGIRAPHGGGLRTYHSIIEILVESSALYSIATLFALIAYIHSGPASEFASAFWTSITVGFRILTNASC